MVYIALKTHLKHILSLIALFLAFMFIINGVPSTLNTRIDSISVNEPEILYNRTMNIFKKNIEYIDRKEIGDISPDTIKELGERLNHILQMKLHKPGVSYEELKKTEAYLNITEANSHLTYASKLYGSIWGDIQESTYLLRRLWVLQAISLYTGIKDKIDLLIHELKTARNILNQTDPGYMDPEHREVLEKSIRVLDENIAMLEEYKRLMEKLIRNRASFQRIASSLLRKDYEASQEDVETAKKVMNEIDLSKLGPLGNNVADFFTKIGSYIPKQEREHYPGTGTPSEQAKEGSGGTSAGGYESVDND